MSRVCPSKFKISFSPIKEMSKEREDATDAARWGTLWKFVNKPTPKTKKKACKDKALTSIRSWDDSSSKEDHHKRRSHKHSSSSSSRVCLMAQGNKDSIPSDSDNDSDSDDELPSYEQLMQKILNMLKVALVNKRS